MSKVYGEVFSKNEYSAHILITSQIKRGAKVLEFGCGAGAITKYLKDNLQCEVTIIEYVREAYDVALQYAIDGYCGDAESLEWMELFKEYKYDYIIFPDVLEHLRNPKNVLDNAKQLLTDEGLIILSVPNGCHSGILSEMYDNNFYYRRVGLLDDTHIHLFSYKSLCKMIAECGLETTIYDAFCAPVELTEFAMYDQVMPASISSMLKEKPMANIYQFIFTLAKPKSNQQIINRLQERMGFTSKIYITDKYNFPLHSLSSSFVNKTEIDIQANLMKKVEFVNFVPMINQGCILKDIQIYKDDTLAEYTTNAYQMNDTHIFLSNEDNIRICGLQQTSVLRVKAKIIHH